MSRLSSAKAVELEVGGGRNSSSLPRGEGRAVATTKQHAVVRPAGLWRNQEETNTTSALQLPIGVGEEEVVSLFYLSEVTRMTESRAARAAMSEQETTRPHLFSRRSRSSLMAAKAAGRRLRLGGAFFSLGPLAEPSSRTDPSQPCSANNKTAGVSRGKKGRPQPPATVELHCCYQRAEPCQWHIHRSLRSS